MRELVIYIIILFFIQTPIFSQIDSSSNTDETINQLIIEPNSEADNSDLYEIIENLKENPVDLNKADMSDLQQIPYLDINIAKLIINYREKNGRFFSKDELYSIKEIPKPTIKKLLPFIIVKNGSSNNYTQTQNYHINFRSRMLEDIQNDKGFVDNKFEGSKYKIYNRFSAEYLNHFQVGFLTDKDAGERRLNDFDSYYFCVKNFGILKKIVAGDYNLKFGQGLALWSQFGFSKGIDAIYPVKKIGKGITPYKSSLENNFYRGFAATLNLVNFSLTAFYSKNKLDADIDSISNEILSTPITGLHRTTTEIEKRKTAQEKVTGANIEYNSVNILNAGLTFYNSVFDYPFAENGVYNIKGAKFNYYSFYFDFFLNDINFFGESVFNGTSVANFYGIEIPVNKNFTFVTAIRSYPKNYINIHGFGFGEKNGNTKNEFGIYNGVKWNLPIGRLNLYYDQFKFPYATYFTPLPTEGNEFLINYNFKPLPKFSINLTFKDENKEIEVSTAAKKLISMQRRKTYRFEIIFSPTKQIRLKSRFQYLTDYVKEIDNFEKGLMIFQDIKFNISKNFRCCFRTSYFKTDSFNSAIYMYENDLNGILYSIPLYGEGLRWYAMINYNVLYFLEFTIKYAETYEPNVNSLGSGYTEVDGNALDRLSLQMDFNL
jgi:Helix-hairpin-helix motif